MNCKSKCAECPANGVTPPFCLMCDFPMGCETTLLKLKTGLNFLCCDCFTSLKAFLGGNFAHFRDAYPADTVQELCFLEEFGLDVTNLRAMIEEKPG